MSAHEPKNMAASVHQRLLNLARAQQTDVNLLFTRYGLERFLYRLSRSPHAGSFVLKGAMLFFVWTGADSRPTRDLDLLAHLEADPEKIRRVIEAICRTPVADDGMEFQSELMQVEVTQALRRFGGFRVVVPARLGNVRLQAQIDLGFGDAVTPAPKRITYPTLLDQPAPELAAYHMETVVAEKLEAMVKLGTTNTRTKDYYDLFALSRAFPFQGADLVSSLTVTFNTRGTPIPADIPEGLADAFASDRAARGRWDTFLDRNELGSDISWAEAVAAIRKFAFPPLHAAGKGGTFPVDWPPGGPWPALG